MRVEPVALQAVTLDETLDLQRIVFRLVLDVGKRSRWQLIAGQLENSAKQEGDIVEDRPRARFDPRDRPVWWKDGALDLNQHSLTRRRSSAFSASDNTMTVAGRLI